MARRRSFYDEERNYDSEKENVEVSNEERPTEPQTRKGIIFGASEVVIRSEPTRTGKMLKRMPVDEQVTIHDKVPSKEMYYEIDLNDGTGRRGFVTTTNCKEVS